MTGLISCTLAAVSTGPDPDEQAAHVAKCRRILDNPDALRWDGVPVKEALMELIHSGAVSDKKPHRYLDGKAVRYNSQMTYEQLCAKLEAQNFLCSYTQAMLDLENGSMLCAQPGAH